MFVCAEWCYLFIFVSFTGIKHELQMNDLSDYGNRDNFAERMGKGVIKVEGHAVTSAGGSR